MPKNQDQVPFSNLLQELELLVGQLESQDAPLEASLTAFEAGVGLVNRAQKRLQSAEQRVQILSSEETDPNMEVQDLDEEQH